MRNLKRALSLAMASIMLLGMMVVGAGAVSIGDFSDNEKIVNQEAVTVLTTLGVIEGKTATTFDPESTVKRGEMAKMICVILNGGKDPQLGETVKNSYTDTANHWAKAYIEYCTTLGIIAGRNDGTFDPEGTVTVAEAGKMILVALGYNAGVEGYTGANWQINTDVRANALRLYDGLGTLNTNVPLTRDNAAQICYNALDEKIVAYNYVITGTVDNSISTKPQLNDSEKGTLLYDKFGAVKVVGVPLANEYANMNSTKTDTEKAPSTTFVGNALDAGKTELLVTNFDDDQNIYTNKAYTFSVATGEEQLGKAVWMFVKPASNGQNSLKATVIGSAIISDENNIITDTTSDKIADVADDNNLDITADTQYAYNYANLGKTALRDGVKGVQKTLVDIDGDNKVDYILLKEMRLGRVNLYTDNTDGHIVVATHDGTNSGNYISKKKTEVIGFADVAKDDMVLTAYIGGRLYVEKAETVTGKIEAYKQNKAYQNTAFTIDGEAYDVSFVHSYSGSDITVANNSITDKTIISSEATFYKDQNGFLVAYGEVDESAYKYAYVWGAEAGTTIGTDRVKVTTEDGKTKTYDLSSNSDIDVVDNVKNPGSADGLKTVDQLAMQGRVYSYAITSGGDIKLYLSKGGTVEADRPTFTKGLTSIHLPSSAAKFPGLNTSTMNPVLTTTYYSNNSTTFFYVSYKTNGAIDKVVVYNGRNNAPTVDGNAVENASSSAILALNAKGDVASAVFDDVSVAESAGDHMFVYKAGFVWDEYGYVNSYFNGSDEVTEDVKVAYVDQLGGEIVHNPDVTNGIYLYKTTDKGYYEVTKPSNQGYYVEGTISRVNKASNTFVIVDDTNTYLAECKLDSKSVVVDYDSSNSSPVAVLNGSVSAGDVVQVIVNNSTDRLVLMAAIMDRTDAGTGDNGNNVDWNVSGTTFPNGLVSLDTVMAEFAKGNNVIINDSWTPTATLNNSTLIVPKGCTLLVKGNLTTTSMANNIVNNGTLMVQGTLTTKATQTLDGTIKAIKIALTGATSITGNVTVTDTLSGTGNVTAESTSTVKATNVTLNGRNLVVIGHVEVNGTLKAAGVYVYSTNTLIAGTLEADTLTVGDGTRAGKATVKSVNKTLAVTVAANSSASIDGTTSGKTVTVSSPLNGSFVMKGNPVLNNTAADFTVAKGANLNVTGTPTLAGSSHDVVLLGSMKITGGLDLGGTKTLTVNDASASASISGEVKGNVTVTAGTATAGSITGTNNGASITDSSKAITLSGTISKNATYTGDVTLANNTKIAKGVTLTVNNVTIGTGVQVNGTLKINGKVTDAHVGNLTVDTVTEANRGLVTVTFGSGATIVGTDEVASFVDKNGVKLNDTTNTTLKTNMVAGMSFAWNTDNSLFTSTTAFPAIPTEPEVPVDPSQTTKVFVNVSTIKIYNGSTELTQKNDPVNGTYVEIPAGVTTIYINNSTWTAGKHYTLNAKDYDVTNGKSIAVKVADLPANKTLNADDFVEKLLVKKNSTNTYVATTATIADLALTGKHVQVVAADGTKAWKVIATDGATRLVEGSNYLDGYYKVTGVADKTTAGTIPTTTVGEYTYATTATADAVKDGNDFYVKAGSTLTVTVTWASEAITGVKDTVTVTGTNSAASAGTILEFVAGAFGTPVVKTATITTFTDDSAITIVGANTAS